ncbi:MAG: hypothetical protein ACK5T3_01710 [Betaproteobacteria bacterium]
MHAAACWLALRRWVWRWAVFAAVAVLVATGGAGVDTALGVARALAAWAALPLARGAAAGGIWAPLAVLGCAGVGLALLASVRQRLWPTAWREAERALPLAPRATQFSDLRIVALASLPWTGLQGLGLLAWLVQSPPWLAGRAGAVVAAGLTALALMLAGGVLMQQLRRRGGPPRRAGLAAAGRAAAVLRPRPWALRSRVLLLWPLGRGLAPRSARHALATAGTGGLLMAATAWRPAWAPAWLGLQALLVLAAVARAQALAALELRPLLAACAALPLSQRAWGWRLDAATAAPALLAVAGLAAVVLVTAPAVHAPVLAAWAGWLVLAVALVLRVPLADAALQSARWLFLLAVAVALGSEVLP